ncbi:MAG: DUF4249 domain-containing protein [Saprospiraceae bacterium]|nr:DUF4249 domain-containing protein [Saprospiraceae bacterium]
MKNQNIIRPDRTIKSNVFSNWLMTLCFGTIFFIQACEEPYTPDTSESQQEYVVEGYVEVGEDSNPVFVIVTRSIPFISTINPDRFSELFVNNANVTVNDGTKTVTLIPVCLSQIPEELREQVFAVLGFNPDSTAVDLCIYADLLGQVTKEYNRRYDLTVKVGDKILTATTTVPEFVPIEMFRWADPPGTPSDTLARLWITIDDPRGVNNYYRYLTATGGEGLIAPFTSVVDDALFDGKKFEFPLQRAQRRGGDFDPDSFGLYRREDSIQVKWCNLDKAHYDFWRTRDFSASSGGPFSSYTRISTNIEGGLGIWGGYSVGHYKLYVPPK